MFNDISIQRFDNNNNKIKTIPIPLHYGPREKWVALLEKPLIDRKIAVQLPMLSFQMTSIGADLSGRKISPLNKYVNIHQNPKIMASSWNSIPYKLTFDLYIITKYADDAAQIFEQIVPYFTPSFTNTVDLISDLNKKFDIKTTLAAVNMEDVYDGEFTARRQIIWTLSFEMEVVFIGPITQQGVIKRIKTDFLASPTEANYPNVDWRHPNERILTMPGLKEDGTPTTKSSESVPYYKIEPTDNYGYIDEWYTFDEVNLNNDPNTLEQFMESYE